MKEIKYYNFKIQNIYTRVNKWVSIFHQVSTMPRASEIRRAEKVLFIMSFSLEILTIVTKPTRVNLKCGEKFLLFIKY